MSNVEWDEAKIIEHYETEMQKAIKEAVLLIEADAKKRCPVDTGRLRSSISNVVKEIKEDVIQGRVGSATEYAPYVEFGTSKMEAQPYLRPALEENFDKVVKLIKAAV